MGQLIVSKKGAVGTVVFSNPTKMNAMTFDMWMGVPKALKEFEADPEIRVIVLKGDGEKAFISGADISQFEDLRSTPEGHQAYEDHLAVAMKYPTVCSKPASPPRDQAAKGADPPPSVCAPWTSRLTDVLKHEDNSD